MKVAKFGGSSLSSAQQLVKVGNIIKHDPAIRFVVVSAPGKRHNDDYKVTDRLIDLAIAQKNGLDMEAIQADIIGRYQSMVDDLGLDQAIITSFKLTLNKYLETLKGNYPRLLDALKSCGEDFNAQLITAYFNQLGINARYISPLEIGIIVTDEPANAQLLPESYDLIREWRNQDELLVIPGFFGYSKSGNIVTFPRGGSDITGAIITRGVQADIYENFTDMSYIYSAHPKMIDNPHPIAEITYREMRELSYAGFSIFHDEALEPLYQVNIPVMIRDTNHPEIEGTKIVASRDNIKEYPVIGISSDEGFTSITLRKYLLNRELGYTSRLLQIFEDQKISIEHVPTGIDNITVVFRTRQLTRPNQLNAIIHEIEETLSPEWISVEDDLAILVIVGEGMREVTGIAHKAMTALALEDINILMINQGGSQISLFIGIKIKDQEAAIRGMYQQYFG
ncbi:aspartate kinase [Fundicoccus culcitae]|uniref:Aspartokinase n=1 Tax=Fundicoccus culcitae TaxID=2969821 RepID=A0ABY5P9Y9_9LACT|nr:aspartate kinase [Fundicoccus culcitae]UUX35354.1 aspartate kinase [Fundicoccus culcitae]